MITEKDRINTCMTKYNLTESESTRIVKSDNDLLTIEELRIKYDYEDLGKNYPDWLDPIDHYKMCCATVRSMYNSSFAQICNPEELASILFIKSSIKLKNINSYKHLKVGLVTITMNVYRDYYRRQKYWIGSSLDSVTDDSNNTLYNSIIKEDKAKEEKDCLNAVLSIKNKEVREILIIAGYILGGIDEFAFEFKKIVNESSLIERDKLLDLLNTIKSNDEIDRCRLDKISCGKKRKRITLKNILSVFKTDLDVDSARIEIGNYLMDTGFIK